MTRTKRRSSAARLRKRRARWARLPSQLVIGPTSDLVMPKGWWCVCSCGAEIKVKSKQHREDFGRRHFRTCAQLPKEIVPA